MYFVKIILNFPKESLLNIKKITSTSFYFSANEVLYKYNLTEKNTFFLFLTLFLNMIKFNILKQYLVQRFG